MSDLRPLLALLVIAACSGPPAPPDATTPDGGTDSGPPVMCGSDMACGDQSVFCMRWRCLPGEPGTDARGCIDLGPPCAAGQECDEERDVCGAPAWCTEGRPGCAVPGDCDNDGARAIECGGNDCDDEDNQRHPGRTEVCDAAGVDEDCNPTTVAGPSDGDMDGDTFTSAECCNGSTCGNDCDDSDVNVNPNASEVCDGIDNDCSDLPDDAAGVCPGGLCVAGSCDFSAWQRAFGGASNRDVSSSVAVDGSGNVYIAGTVAGNADLGGPAGVTAPADADSLFVVKYGPDGTWAWQYVSADAGSIRAARLAVDAGGTRVFVVGSASGIDFGSGSSSGAFLVRLSGESGAYLGDQRFGTAASDELRAVAIDAAGITVAGSYSGTVDFGGGMETAAGNASVVLLRLTLDGDYAWHRIFRASGSDFTRGATAESVTVSGASIVVGGRYFRGSLTLGTTTLPATGSGSINGFVARFDATGTPTWARALEMASSSARPWSIVTSGASVYAAGEYAGGPMAVGSLSLPSSTDPNGFVVALAEGDGAPRWVRQFGGNGGGDAALALAIDASGSLLVAGGISTPWNFGSGMRMPSGCMMVGAELRCPVNAFIARYTDGNLPQSDRLLSAGGNTYIRSIVVGPGDSTALCGDFIGTTNFGAGAYVSQGLDAFVLRLGT